MKIKKTATTAFDNIKRKLQYVNINNYSAKEQVSDMNVIEKHLEQSAKEHNVLKLIVAKNVNIEILKMSKDVKDYNWFIYPSKERILTKDEFNSLKETICESL